MKVKVIEKHDGEGCFPTFTIGTSVTVLTACTHYLHWYACKIGQYHTYIPMSYVEKEALVMDYNPTELVQEVGDILTVKRIVHAWMEAKNSAQQIGWFPLEKVISIEG